MNAGDVSPIPSTPRERIGNWSAPSGNGVTVFYQPIGPGLGEVTLEWDAPPPLSPDDARFYQTVVLPNLVARLREFTEAIGPVPVVSA